jgi:putative beta-lysine N-acetyltransferase
MYIENQEDIHKTRHEKHSRIRKMVTTENQESGDSDITTEIDTALIQHGRNNNRIYLMDVGGADGTQLCRKLDDIAEAHSYEKIFAKIPASKAEPFLSSGYSIEARVKGMYARKENGLFLSKYLNAQRSREPLARHHQMVATLALSKADSAPSPMPEGYSIRLCGEGDVNTMAEIYGQVFDSYPFPVDDPAFLTKSIQSETIFACVENGEDMIAVASAECSFRSDHLYAEMTDFATLSEFRGGGLASHLLNFLETEIAQHGIKTAYTIARAVSAGMNITFSRSGYAFGGRLKNNTDIAGRIESMNVWYKSLE